VAESGRRLRCGDPLQSRHGSILLSTLLYSTLLYITLLTLFYSLYSTLLHCKAGMAPFSSARARSLAPFLPPFLPPSRAFFNMWRARGRAPIVCCLSDCGDVRVCVCVYVRVRVRVYVCAWVCVRLTCDWSMLSKTFQPSVNQLCHQLFT